MDNLTASRIEDYTLIGDCETTALVGRDGLGGLAYSLPDTLFFTDLRIRSLFILYLALVHIASSSCYTVETTAYVRSFSRGVQQNR